MTFESTLALILQNIVAGGLAFVGFLALLPTKLGEKLLGHYFERRMNAIKDESNRQIEALREQLSHVGDRGKRSNENEFSAIRGAWEHFVDAYISTQASISMMISHPDFKKMSDEDVAAYLETTEFSKIQQEQIRAATNKNEMFANVTTFRAISKASNEIFDTRQWLRKNGIFMPHDLETKMEAALEVLSRAQIQRRMEFNDRGSARELDSISVLFRDGPKLFDELKTMTRSRLFRE